MTIFPDKLNSNNINCPAVGLPTMYILGILVSVRSCEKQVIYVLLAMRIKLREVLIAIANSFLSK